MIFRYFHRISVIFTVTHSSNTNKNTVLKGFNFAIIGFSHVLYQTKETVANKIEQLGGTVLNTQQITQRKLQVDIVIAGSIRIDRPHSLLDYILSCPNRPPIVSTNWLSDVDDDGEYKDPHEHPTAWTEEIIHLRYQPHIRGTNQNRRQRLPLNVINNQPLDSTNTTTMMQIQNVCCT